MNLLRNFTKLPTHQKSRKKTAHKYIFLSSFMRMSITLLNGCESCSEQILNCLFFVHPEIAFQWIYLICVFYLSFGFIISFSAGVIRTRNLSQFIGFKLDEWLLESLKWIIRASNTHPHTHMGHKDAIPFDSIWEHWQQQPVEMSRWDAIN